MQQNCKDELVKEEEKNSQGKISLPDLSHAAPLSPHNFPYHWTVPWNSLSYISLGVLGFHRPLRRDHKPQPSLGAGVRPNDSPTLSPVYVCL